MRAVLTQSRRSSSLAGYFGIVIEFPVTSVDAVDTTGAGDGFNGGYLAARLQNKPIVQAAQLAMLLAKLTVQQKGAILPPEQISNLA